MEQLVVLLLIVLIPLSPILLLVGVHRSFGDRIPRPIQIDGYAPTWFASAWAATPPVIVWAALIVGAIGVAVKVASLVI